jgi:hypothetical protein
LSEQAVNEQLTAPDGATVVDTTICIAQETQRVAGAHSAAATMHFDEQVITEHAVLLVDGSPERAAVCGFIYLRPNLKLDCGWTKVNMFRRCTVCADILGDHPGGDIHNGSSA